MIPIDHIWLVYYTIISIITFEQTFKNFNSFMVLWWQSCNKIQISLWFIALFSLKKTVMMLQKTITLHVDQELLYFWTTENLKLIYVVNLLYFLERKSFLSWISNLLLHTQCTLFLISLCATTKCGKLKPQFYVNYFYCMFSNKIWMSHCITNSNSYFECLMMCKPFKSHSY